MLGFSVFTSRVHRFAAFLLAGVFAAPATLHGSAQAVRLAGASFDEIQLAAHGFVPYSDFEELSQHVAGTRHIKLDGQALIPCVIPSIFARAIALGRYKLMTSIRRSYLGDDERADDLIAQRAMIYLAHKNKIIFLDLRAKAYDIEEGHCSNPLTGYAGFPEPAKTLYYREDRRELGLRTVGNKQFVAYSVSSDFGFVAKKLDAWKPFISQDGHIYFVRDPRWNLSTSTRLSDMERFYRPPIRTENKIILEEKGPSLPRAIRVYQTSHFRFHLHSSWSADITLMRAHLRTLTEADRSLFDVPKGFRKDQSASRLSPTR